MLGAATPRRIEDMELEMSLVEKAPIFDRLMSEWKDPQTTALLSKRAGVDEVIAAIDNQELEIVPVYTATRLNDMSQALVGVFQNRSVYGSTLRALPVGDNNAEYHYASDLPELPEVSDSGPNSTTYPALTPEALDAQWEEEHPSTQILPSVIA